jgi:hypothetical protein
MQINYVETSYEKYHRNWRCELRVMRDKRKRCFGTAPDTGTFQETQSLEEAYLPS